MWQYSDQEFVRRQALEVGCARARYRKGDEMAVALGGRVGMLARALLEHSWHEVMGAATRVAALAQLLAAESTDFAIQQADEVRRARVLFPKPDALMTALTEEAGELADAHLDEPTERVLAEAVQVAAMAQRLATEGDPTLVEVRRERLKLAIEKGKQPPGSGFGPRCPFLGCQNPMSPTRPPCALCYE